MAPVVVLSLASLVAAACGASDGVKKILAAKASATAAPAESSAGPVADGATAEVPVSAPDLPGQAEPSSTGSTSPRPASPRPAGPAVDSPVTPANPTGGTTPGAPAPAGTAGVAPTPGSPASPAAGDNGGATDTGVTADRIKIGGLYFNGSWLDRYTQIAEQAARAYFRYVNDQGGVHGRLIDYVTCDTAATADGTQSCARKLGDGDKVFALGPSMDLFSNTLTEYITNKKLPWVGTMGYYATDLDNPYIFPTQLTSRELAGLIATFTGRTLQPKTVGVLWLKDFVGEDCLDQVRKSGAKLGFSVAVEASSGTTEDDMTPQVVRMRTANPAPDAVLFCTDAVNQTKFMQAAARQNWNPPKGWVGAYAAIDDVPKAIGPTAKGMYAITTFDYYGADTPGVVKYRQITEHYYPSIFHHFFTQATYTGAVATVEALRAAGPNLTRDRYLAALRSMSDFDSGMGLKFDFADKHSFRHSSGLVLQADADLRWQVVGQRFAAVL